MLLPSLLGAVVNKKLLGGFIAGGVVFCVLVVALTLHTVSRSSGLLGFCATSDRQALLVDYNFVSSDSGSDVYTYRVRGLDLSTGATTPTIDLRESSSGPGWPWEGTPGCIGVDHGRVWFAAENVDLRDPKTGAIVVPHAEIEKRTKIGRWASTRFSPSLGKLVVTNVFHDEHAIDAVTFATTKLMPPLKEDEAPPAGMVEQVGHPFMGIRDFVCQGSECRLGQGTYAGLKTAMPDASIVLVPLLIASLSDGSVFATHLTELDEKARAMSRLDAHGKTMWTSQVVKDAVPLLLLLDGDLLVVGDDTLHLIGMADGKTQWTLRTQQPLKRQENNKPLIIRHFGDELFVAQNRQLFLVDAKNGQLRWRQEL